MIKLIVNADDFGYSRGINYGIIDAHKNGIVNSATMMMNMPGVSHAVELAKENPGLQVGIHLVLTCGKPLLHDVPTLVNEEGNFKSRSEFFEHKNISLEELEREWTKQIETFLESGLKPTHFDSHHHVHSIPEFLPVVQKLSKKYNLSVRRISENALHGVTPFTDVFLHGFYGEGVTEDYFEKVLTHVQDGQSVEVMCHPGYLDHEILNNSSYAKDRVKETLVLTAVKLPKEIVLL
ncbi:MULTISPECIES: chitin disaccharide deacetylase [unclassified Bacillus (in: firmicutes)]|uniref:chitin disaccharide deacetylase n=1 Tax=unclassified Bacillus (in: firmicutes) TaxID=185979 RepID=UPI000BF05452|nr:MULTISPECIES: chitin disaccharide deacetylase [unclassified Bacillus (in: firmicutes)]PEJ57750.1 chitin disaccharide deacetylase [Bacillus sp. AFS002410]PEL11937.1 chitin disaccharide deacetylase [Bacillus sp. AFS017336]